MSPEELSGYYAESARPYLEADGPVPAGVLSMKSWRYLIEINTACNFRCALCMVGNSAGYERTKNEFMDMGLLEKVLDKIKSENPGAIICSYGNGEPFLNPNLPECVAAIKRRGFRCEVASNLNKLNRLDDFLRAGPDLFIISTSGFSQETYSKAHIGGDIEKLKANLWIVAEARQRVNPKVHVAVSYHMYRDNQGYELTQMRVLTEALGFQFMICWARVITIENAIQSLRQIDVDKGVSVPPFAVKDGMDWNKLLPPSKPEFVEAMKRLNFPPERAREAYARFPVPKLCVIADVFTYIRHDGQVQLCAWTDDRRLLLGNYLEMSQEQLSAARRFHPICAECLRYRLNLYFHVCDCTKFDSGGL